MFAWILQLVAVQLFKAEEVTSFGHTVVLTIMRFQLQFSIINRALCISGALMEKMD